MTLLIPPRAAALLVLLIVATGCATSGPDPSVSSSGAPGTPPPAASPTPGSTPGSTVAAPTPATSPSGFAAELVQPGGLVICSAFPRRRFAEFDAQGNPFGVDVEIGLALAGELELEPVVREVVFDELLDAVVDGLCDVAISGHFISAERLQVVDLIAYREGSVSPVVRAGNPLGIEAITDLCARTVAIVEGTIYRDIIRGEGEYEDSGIDQQCAGVGKAAVDLAEYPTEDAAVAAFAAGDADVFIGNEAIASDRPTEFARSPALLPRLRNGIAHRLGATALDEALRTALRGVIEDGTYDAILERHGVGDIGVTELP